MHYYEYVGLIPGNLAENEVEPIFASIVTYFETAGGTIKRKEIIGRKKMAYAINNMRHAYYFVIGVELENESIQTIEKQLKLDANVMRFLATKLKPKTDAMIKKEQERLARQASQIANENNDEPVKEKKQTRKPKSEKTETTQKEPEADITPTKNEPVDIAQLEKKLDEILEEEIK